MLVEWLKESGLEIPAVEKYRILEIGALSPSNACSRSKFFDVERIDLHSQHPDILEQDFMERAAPGTGEELENKGFDVVSLSLVVNYVPDAAGRGEMLGRVGRFLRRGEKKERVGWLKESNGEKEEAAKGLFPALFLVLPASCVGNSRYLDEGRLEGILRSLGFVRVKRKMSTKLVYYLWRFEGFNGVNEVAFPKEEVRKGRDRNNFAIVLS